LDGEGLKPKEIFVVYNPTLVQGFAQQRAILNRRYNQLSSEFLKTDWKEQANTELRTFTMEQYQKRAALFEWNTDQGIVVLPVVHGTDSKTAFAIAASGFANLSVLDDGFYGKGIYFTSSARYAFPYYATKKNPAVIIGYCITGHPYPVIENPNQPKSFSGCALRVGYQSHYVITNKGGLPITSKNKRLIYDEIVIDQESHIIPVNILTFVAKDLMGEMKKWGDQRDK